MSEYPIVQPDDDGIRPAGPQDECFYCRRKIGQRHGSECVTVTKKIKVRYSVNLTIEVPRHWDEGAVLFHRLESSWCADNAIGEIRGYAKSRGCLCGDFSVEILDMEPANNGGDDD